MPFSKTFPKTVKGSNYPQWDEVYLTDEEERIQEITCRKENINLMKQCIEDAKNIIEQQNLKRFQSDLIRVAIALFGKKTKPKKNLIKKDKAKFVPLSVSETNVVGIELCSSMVQGKFRFTGTLNYVHCFLQGFAETK